MLWHHLLLDQVQGQQRVSHDTRLIHLQPADEGFSEEHALFCKIYTEVSPRPSKAHRLHILFPASEENMRFTWVPNCQNNGSRQKALDSIVDPSKARTEGFAGFDESGFSGMAKCRAVSGWYVDMFVRLPESHQNRSVGLVVNGKPASYFRGNLALAASNMSIMSGDLVPVDALPHDLPKLLQCMAREEVRAGSKVKMAMMKVNLEEYRKMMNERYD
jgi:hypothetical protein